MKTEMTPARIRRVVESFESRGVHYMVIAGVGLDGRRGYLTRSHQDLDVLCPKEGLSVIDDILQRLGYVGTRYNDLYKAFDGRGGKLDIGLVSFEDDEAVMYGRIAITRFPKVLFDNPQRGGFDGVAFNVAPDELLKTWGSYSPKGSDAEYASSLDVDEGLASRITRELRQE
mgnify:CR=1 FL=1